MINQLRKDMLEALPPLFISMIYKFSVHAAKGPWTGRSMQTHINHLKSEVVELVDAVQRGATVEEVLDEAADVANLALIICHVYGKNKEEPWKRRQNESSNTAGGGVPTTGSFSIEDLRLSAGGGVPTPASGVD